LVAAPFESSHYLAPLFLDCDHNPDCAFNRFVGFSSGAEQAALSLGRAAPLMTSEAVKAEKHFENIAAAADRFVDRVDKHQPWWVLGFGR
jgi:hypothetical protein